MTEFSKKLREVLRNTDGFRENHTHLIIHCPFCETERDPNKHGHLYISIEDNKNNPYSCKKCPAASYSINIELLSRLGIQDTDIIKYVKDNFKSSIVHTISMNEREMKLNYKINKNVSPKSLDKINYLNNRLNHNFNNEDDLIKFKIITSFKRFIKLNNIIPEKEFDTSNLSKINLIEKCYIGFLSHYGNIIIFRKIIDDKSIDKHIMFPLSKIIDKPFLYTPKSAIDPLTDDPVINVAEGVFDIIRILLKFDNGNNNNMYIASGSLGGFKRAIRQALNISGFYGCKINMWMDNDDLVTNIIKFDFKAIIKALRVFARNFKVIAYVNLASKDFGDCNKPLKLSNKNLTNII